jgi:hypothetical protein
VFGFACILLVGGLSFAQSFRGPDVRPRGHRAEPVRVNFSISGTPSANQIWPAQCLDNILFPGNFSGIFPDAGGSASCGTNPSESDTYTIKVAGAQIGTVALSAAITEVNSWASSATGSASSATVNTSSGSQMQTNDVCVMSAIWYSGVTFSSITGGAGGTWTAVYTAFSDTVNNLSTQGSYYHVVTASDIGATFTVTWSGGAFTEATITCYRGVSTSSPIDVSGTGNLGSGTSATASGITTTHTGDAVIYVAGTGQQSSTLTVPTGFTQRWNVPFVSSSVDGSMGADLIGSYTSGTSESGTLGTSVHYTAILFALTPIGGASCTPTFTTTNGQPQPCLAGQRLELDAPGTVSGKDIVIGLPGHVP